ncbi:MAG: hypothetical protein GEU93_12930 [Propionibacteriales bacterium]|nr:hypothetical protein [Propionibacteriales bacterium]
MNRTLTAIKEWINPNWATHMSIPPMERGLRPNSRLDHAHALLTPGDYEPEDLLVLDSGAIWFSSGTAIQELKDGNVRTVAELGGPVGTLTKLNSDIVAAVEGRGLVSVSASESVSQLCSDTSVATCVTDLTALPDGSLLASVGSTEYGIDGWGRALVHHDRSGRLVQVDGQHAQVRAEGLGWPAGMEADPDGEVLVSLSLDHRIERRAADSLDGAARPMLTNLPLYPGRISLGDNGWWVAGPYVRNRITALLLDEPELLGEMVATINPDEWFIPRLRSENPYTDPLQMGQLRTLGVVKPWAPPRSYGVAFRIDRGKRISESVHSRVDGKCHGITRVTAHGTQVIAAAQGFRSLVEIEEE